MAAEPLLALPGCGTLTAAKLVAEVAGVERFSNDAKLAKLAGVAPLDRPPIPPRNWKTPSPKQGNGNATTKIGSETLPVST